MGLSINDASRNEIKNILVIICIRIGRYKRGMECVRRAKPVADRLANNMNQWSYMTQVKFTLNTPQPSENFYEHSCHLPPLQTSSYGYGDARSYSLLVGQTFDEIICLYNTLIWDGKILVTLVFFCISVNI